MTPVIDAAPGSATTPTATTRVDLLVEQRSQRTAPLLRLSCSDLDPECRTELTGRTTEELLLEYVEHSFRCLHRTAPADLDRVQSTITTA